MGGGEFMTGMSEGAGAGVGGANEKGFASSCGGATPGGKAAFNSVAN